VSGAIRSSAGALFVAGGGRPDAKKGGGGEYLQTQQAHGGVPVGREGRGCPVSRQHVDGVVVVDTRATGGGVIWRHAVP
jgi:hypothetical protein